MPKVAKHEYWSSNFGSKITFAARPQTSEGYLTKRPGPLVKVQYKGAPLVEGEDSDAIALRRLRELSLQPAPRLLPPEAFSEVVPPQPAVLQWSADELAASLAPLGEKFAPIADALLAHGVDGRWIPKLTADTLPSLGVRSFEQV